MAKELKITEKVTYSKELNKDNDVFNWVRPIEEYDDVLEAFESRGFDYVGEVDISKGAIHMSQNCYGNTDKVNPIAVSRVTIEMIEEVGGNE